MSDTTLNSDELRQLIREAMQDVPTYADVDKRIETALNDRPTLRHVNELVDAKIEASIEKTFLPVLAELKKFTSEFSEIKRQLAVLVEQGRNLSERMRDVNDEQKRIDSEQDEIKRTLAKVETRLITQEDKTESQERAIFGDPARQGVGSLFDHITAIGKAQAEQLGVVKRELDTSIQAACTEIRTLKTEVEGITARLEPTLKWVHARQKVEQFVVHSLPEAGKWLAQSIRNEKLLWLGRLLLAVGISLALALLERVQ